MFFPYRKLNTGIQDVNGIKYINFGEYKHGSIALDDLVKEIFVKTPATMDVTYIGSFMLGSTYRIIIQSHPSGLHASAILFSYALKGAFYYTKINGIVKRYTTNWLEASI